MIEEIDGELRIKGRGISKGKAEGPGLKSNLPLSLTDDVDLETSEILDKENEIYGEPIKDRVLIFPYSRETENYPNTLQHLKDKQLQPIAIVAGSLDVTIIQDAINSKVPAVDRIDTSLFVTRDDVIVNGTGGAVSLKNVTLKKIATSVLTSRGKVLILKRSDDVGTYQGRWACVSGYIEKGETADETALREISEEVGLEREDHEFLRKGEVLYARDKETMWAIHPFLFKAGKAELKLDWEHEEYKWISPNEIINYSTVPKLKETIESVLTMENGENLNSQL